MIQRDTADGFEIAVEHGVDNSGANAILDEVSEARTDGLRATRERGEIDQADLAPALARQHPHQIGVVHRIERMILQRAFVQRHGAHEQIALIDGAAGFRKGRRHQHDGVAGIGAQRVHHRADIAGIGGIEGRADLEQHVTGAAAAQPFLRGARTIDRNASLDRAALERHHHRIDLGQREVVGRHADGLHRTQALTGQRVGEVGSAGVVVGDAAQRQFHGFTPA